MKSAAGPAVGRVGTGAFVPPHWACSSLSCVQDVEDAEGGGTGIVGIRGPFMGERKLTLRVSSLHRALGRSRSGSSQRPPLPLAAPQGGPGQPPQAPTVVVRHEHVLAGVGAFSRTFLEPKPRLESALVRALRLRTWSK